MSSEMKRRWAELGGVLLLLLLETTGGFQYFQVTICKFNSSQVDDIEYIYSRFYNKKEVVRFTSSSGEYEGFTDLGIKLAENGNKNSKYFRRAIKYIICVPDVILWDKYLLSVAVEPYAVLSTAPSAGTVLVCSVYGFFPKEITVTWTNHEQPIQDGVSSTDTLPNADWTYQLHYYLDYVPRSGDQISCMIEHKSLKEPMVLEYEGVLSYGDRNKVAIGASGLVLGLVLALSGFLCYRHKSTGLILVPNH